MINSCFQEERTLEILLLGKAITMTFKTCVSSLGNID